MVTIVGSIGTCYNKPFGQFQLPYFELKTSAYNPSQAAPVQFSVFCFFEKGRRWQNVKMPSSGSYVCVTAKIVGCTAESNCLAIRVLDLSYLPKSTSTMTPPTPDSTSTPTSKRTSRWDGRVDSSTLSKRMRNSDTESGFADNLEESSAQIAETAPYTPPTIQEDEIYKPLASAHESISDDPAMSPLSSIPSQVSDHGSPLTTTNVE
jgi:hypothetical protein